jgi:hypothetical protein
MFKRLCRATGEYDYKILTYLFQIALDEWSDSFPIAIEIEPLVQLAVNIVAPKKNEVFLRKAIEVEFRHKLTRNNANISKRIFGELEKTEKMTGARVNKKFFLELKGRRSLELELSESAVLHKFLTEMSSEDAKTYCPSTGKLGETAGIVFFKEDGLYVLNKRERGKSYNQLVARLGREHERHLVSPIDGDMTRNLGAAVTVLKTKTKRLSAGGEDGKG